MDNFERLAANAELVIKTFPDASLDYDSESVEWIDGYIERNREKWDDATKMSLANVLGSFLGEVMILNLNAFWEEDENGFAVVFSDGNRAYPLNKAGKHIANGPEDSIYSFYQTAEQLFT
jgi:hypothetical protein